MDHNEYIQDKGLFLEQKDFNFSLPDSFETIYNFLKTIKEFRDYNQPDSPTWQEYILEFFQVLGFHTEKQASRLVSLSDIGAHHALKALAILLAPGENFDEIIPDMDWLSYLFYAGNYHRVRWGIITNGLEMKVFDLQRIEYRQNYFLVNIDGIVQNGRLDSFFTIYKIFSYMRGYRERTTPHLGDKKTARKKRKSQTEYDLSFHTDNVSPSTVELLEAIRAKILSLSNDITENFTKKYIGYKTHKYFCEICVQKNQLKVWVDANITGIDDPFSICRDVRNIGHYGSGEIEINLDSDQYVDAAFEVIRQAYHQIR